ncbi:MAG TPA: mechanosensitive ion channel domain-containing protein [Steroidobacteraceae bacterium]|nr:mechanosensitive ion channel domain-containing protein [Steroidobacteraceae bacterium]
MLRFRRLAALFLAGSLITLAAAADSPAPASRPAEYKRAVLTGDQVVQILDETVDWYRTLGAQQQSATQPSDLLILYANRQVAEKVLDLAFQIARANAELLSSEADLEEKTAESTGTSRRNLVQVQAQLEARRQTLQQQIATLKSQLPTAKKAKRSEIEAKLGESQSELDLVNARLNMVSTMSQFVFQSDTARAGANSLKQHIDAIAASIPSSGVAAPALTSSGASSGATPASSAAAPAGAAREETGARRLGIWDLAGTVLRLQAKIGTIDEIDRRTAELQDTFKQIRTPPLEQIKALSARGDELAKAVDNANSRVLRDMRGQFDTLAWLFKQTASILVPLSQQGVLLDQYRSNLKSWRGVTHNQYREAWKALGVRVALLLALLALVFAAAELWRRTVFRYIHEPRRRYQLLLIRKIVLGVLVVAIVGITFATELSSLATFAGLITAGLAVAMQSVLVSIVGYFFLIGKYGIRIGDRVQIGTVTGEVIELGLVRLHLMELSGSGPLGPTGRVVGFANSIVFQASGGIFKQIPGVNLAWHDITLKLPEGCDYNALKERLLTAANAVIADYREDFARQTREIQRTTSLHDGGEAQAQVQLRFSVEGVEATVRYPVQITRAAEIDERISREMLNVIRAAAHTPPPALGQQR